MIRPAVHAATPRALAITTLFPGFNLKNLALEEGKKRGRLQPENPKPFKRPSGTPTAEDLWSLSELDQYAANWADYCEAASELLTKHARSIGLFKKFEVIEPKDEESVVEVDIAL